MSTMYLKEVQLPSKGVLYNGAIPSGLVQIEPMGTREEKLFAGGQKGSAVINRIYDLCLHLPNNFDHRDLVVGDRLFILLQLRAITYGSEYSYSFKCHECRKKSTGILNLNNLPLLTPPEGFTGFIPVTFPLARKTAELRLLTGKDEDKVDQYSAQLQKHGADSEGASYVYRLARRIEKIDDQPVGIKEAMEFVDSLKGLDSLAISEALDQYDVGPVLEVNPDCTSCQYPNGPMTLPLDQEFFRPRRRRPGHTDPIETAVVLDNDRR